MDALPAGVGLMICLIPGLMCLSITKGHQALYEKFVMTEQLSTKMDKKQPHTEIGVGLTYMSGSLKTKVPGPLERQVALVSFHKQTKFLTCKGKLHPVTAFHLESYIVRGGEAGMVHSGTAVAAVSVPGHMGPFGYDRSRYRQSGRMVILVPLLKAFYSSYYKGPDHNYKDYQKHDSKQRKLCTEPGAKHTHFFLSFTAWILQ